MLCTVSKEFREAAEGDCLWQIPYMDRFYKQRRGVLALTPSREREDADADVNATATTDEEWNGGRRNSDERRGGFKNLYMRRMQDPHVRAWGVMKKQ